MKSTQNQLKNSNLNHLRKIIQQKQRVTKPQLAELSGLSTMTVNNLMKDLVENNEVTELQEVATTGGRRASIFEFNAMHQMILTLCMLEKKKSFAFLFSVHDLNGTIVEQEEVIGNNFDKVLIKKYIELFLEHFPKISCLVIGLPGVEHEGVLQVMDFPLLRGEQLTSYLTECFDFDILIENDINAATYGFSRQTSEIYRNAVVGLYYPESFPPGAGVVVNGHLIRGRNGLAGEISHLPSDPDWATFSFSEEAVIDNLLNNIQTYMSLYDPDCFVIYRENPFGDLLLKEKITERIKIEFPYIESPRIIQSIDFHRDYIHGLFALGSARRNQSLETLK